jgi:hypothetical protein
MHVCTHPYVAHAKGGEECDHSHGVLQQTACKEAQLDRSSQGTPLGRKQSRGRQLEK